MAENEPRLEDIERQLTAETKAYADKRAVLEDALAELFRDPSDAVDGLLSWADEFGRDHALELFAEEIHKSPDALEVSPDRWSDMLTAVNGNIERVMDSQERLDELTRQRETVSPSLPNRSINIHGELFEIDAVSMRARSHAGQQTIDIEPEQALTLTEQIAHDIGISKAEPNPQEKDRSRSR